MVSYLPTNIKDALELRSQKSVVPYGGGTDLMIEAEKNISYLFLHKVPEMKKIKEADDFIYIGASCTFTEVAKNPLCPPILKDAIEQIAAPAIRNMGTIGGNIGNGSPKADTALVFFATDAKLRLMSKDNERIIPIKSFYKGKKQLDLKSDELIVEVLFPKAALGNYYYQKVGARKALAISRISFTGLLKMENDIIVNCATAFGAVSDVVIRREDIDALFIGKTINEAKTLKEAYLKAYDEAIVPIRGRVSEAYRKDVCMNLLKDFLNINGI